jgi:hypothetical protein
MFAPALAVIAPLNVIAALAVIVWLTVIEIAPAMVKVVPELVMPVADERITAPVPVLLKVPELEIPPPNVYAELFAVETDPPELMVTKPVNVLDPPLLSSDNKPDTEVVPLTLKVEEDKLSVVPEPTDRLPKT